MRLIDADALKIDIMCVYGSNPQYINWLNHAPTVDAVPVRHGHWVGIDDEPCEVWECDACGYIYEADGKLHRYCPNCGARMVEDE